MGAFSKTVAELVVFSTRTKSVLQARANHVRPPAKQFVLLNAPPRTIGRHFCERFSVSRCFFDFQNDSTQIGRKRCNSELLDILHSFNSSMLCRVMEIKQDFYHLNGRKVKYKSENYVDDEERERRNKLFVAVPLDNRDTVCLHINTLINKYSFLQSRICCASV